MNRAWTISCLGVATLALGLLTGPTARAGEGGLPHHGWGVELDHGVGPYRGAYDAPIPGWRPGPECGRHGHDNGPKWATYFNANSHSPYVRTGLYRYPWFGTLGYIPAGPHDDCLYRTGRGPLKR